MNETFLNLVKEALEIENADISLEDSFRELPNWDSLALLSMISAIDDEYNVVITGEVFKRLNTLGDVLNEIQKLR